MPDGSQNPSFMNNSGLQQRKKVKQEEGVNTKVSEYTGWAKTTLFHCNNFVYGILSLNFHIFGTYTP